MTPPPVTVHAHGDNLERGMRSFFEDRDLDIATATEGAVVSHVIRAAGGTDVSSQPHPHGTTFQLVYVLKGGSIRV